MGSEGAAVGELVTALEQATLMAKQLVPHSTTHLDPSQILHIYSSLHKLHHHLSLFLSHHHPQPQPTLPPPPPENSVSSAVGGGGDDNNDTEPMQMGDDDDDEVEHNSKTTITTIEAVEERMRDCFIQNKRPKRPLSPSATAEQLRSFVNQVAAVRGASSSLAAEEFDPERTKLRSLDLIHQFHA
ncbi:hypothetical protein ACH5RR_000248 [Cinchona calisaya]|uniref:Uncharacterized protein n=1 Tax=Cinchona calisaya TaxID=153742 RepID=A0ABD3B033_9GENT